jgi:hypothetical protein
MVKPQDPKEEESWYDARKAHGIFAVWPFAANSQKYVHRSCRGIGALLKELTPKYSAGILLIWLYGF